VGVCRQWRQIISNDTGLNAKWTAGSVQSAWNQGRYHFRRTSDPTSLSETRNLLPVGVCERRLAGGKDQPVVILVQQSLVWLDVGFPTQLVVQRLGAKETYRFEAHLESINQFIPGKHTADTFWSCGDDGFVRLWRLGQQVCVREWAFDEAVINCDCDATGLFAALTPTRLHIGTISQINTTTSIELSASQQEMADSLCIALNSTHAVIGSPDGLYAVHNLHARATRQIMDPLMYPPERIEPMGEEMVALYRNHPCFVQIVNNVLITRSRRPHELCVWDLETFRLACRLSEGIATKSMKVDEWEIPFVDVSLNGRVMLASVQDDEMAQDDALLSWQFDTTRRVFSIVSFGYNNEHSCWVAFE
jgi:hypothetical protein